MLRLKKVILSFFLPLLMIGCSSPSETSGKVRVLSTTAQIHDLVASIGGERVEAKVLIRGDLDPHSYEIVKGDGEKLSSANLIFYNGLGLEHGASLSAYLHTSPKAVAVGEKIGLAHPEK